MKIFKRVLIGIGLFILALIQIGLFLPKEYKIERTVWIDQQAKQIFPYISNLKSWEQWSVWSKNFDPTYTNSFEGPESGVGAIKKWQGEKIGKGTMEVSLFIEDRLITYDLSLENDGFVASGKIELIPKEGGTEVIWTEEGDFGFNLIGRYLGLLMDNMMGKHLENSLQKLKSLIESDI